MGGDTATSNMLKSQIIPCNEGADSCEFRIAQNEVKQAGQGLLKYTSDDPNAGGLALEGLAYTGDSGGPAFIDGKIAGVNSGGECCAYGSEDQYCRLSDKLPWLQGVVASGQAPAIPDCSAFVSPEVETEEDSSETAVPPPTPPPATPPPATPPPTAKPLTDEEKEVLHQRRYHECGPLAFCRGAPRLRLPCLLLLQRLRERARTRRV